MGMLSKMQKTWSWIFGAIFLIPEIIFFTIPSTIINYSTKGDFLALYSFFVNRSFFIDNWSYAFVVLTIEIIGVLGLFIISIKSRQKVFAILLILVLLWLCFIAFIGYISSKIQLVI